MCLVVLSTLYFTSCFFKFLTSFRKIDFSCCWQSIIWLICPIFPVLKSWLYISFLIRKWNIFERFPQGQLNESHFITKFFSEVSCISAFSLTDFHYACFVSKWLLLIWYLLCIELDPCPLEITCTNSNSHRQLWLQLRDGVFEEVIKLNELIIVCPTHIKILIEKAFEEVIKVKWGPSGGLYPMTEFRDMA